MKKLIMMVALMPLMALADAVWTDSNTGIKWTYQYKDGRTVWLGGLERPAVSTSTTGDLIIPSTIDGMSVTRIADWAFNNCDMLTSVTIPSSVTSIGDSAFYNCTGLTSVTIPESVTSIGGHAFHYCYGLTSVTIPKGVKTVGVCTFDSCGSLTSVTISEGVTSIGERAFYDCRSLTSLMIPSSVTSIGYSAFTFCSGIKLATMPACVTRLSDVFPDAYTKINEVVLCDGVTGIGNCAFDGCSGLASITIPSSVTSIGAYAFRGCSGLTSITMPSSVTSIGDCAFDGCSGLASITIPSSVTSIGACAFRGCGGLADVTGLVIVRDVVYGYFGDSISVIVPSSVTSIGEDAFYDCSGLTSVAIPKSVTSIGKRAFSGCSGLTSVTIPACVTRLSNVFPSAYEKIKEVVLCDGVTCIEDYAFQYCYALTSLTIPASVTSIGKGAFYECRSLTSLTIPSSVTSIGERAFYDCRSFTSLMIPSSVMSIGEGAFALCSGIESVTIPEGVTSIGDDVFSGCSGLKSITIPEGVTGIGEHAFSGCSGLASLTIPSSVTSIGDVAFRNCSGLTSVTIPSSVMSIGVGAFAGCSGLSSIVLPFVGAQRGNSGTTDELFGYIFGTAAYSGATATKQYYSNSASSTYYIPDALKSVIITDETKIGYGAFYNCSGLTSVTIPESVTTIEEKAFYGCSGLGDGVVANDGWVLCVNGNVASAEIPDGVKQIVPGAFAGHTELKSVKLPPTLERINEKDFSGCTGLEGVYVTDLAAWCGMVFESAKANPLYYAKKLYLNEKELIYLDIPMGVEEIGQYAFYNCNRFMSVTIPSSVKSVGADAFGGCSGLSAVNISDLSAWCGINFASAAANPLYCAKKLNLNGNEVVDLTVPSGTESIGQYAFYNGMDIASVTIPNSVTSIGTDAFKGCTGVKSATVPECFTLSSVFPDSYANMPAVTIPADATSIADGAFSGCSKITSIAIPSTVTSIGANAFSGCSGLTAIVIPESVTDIGASAFRGCTQIVEMEIPEGVGELPNSLCEGCSGLTTVAIPNSVSNISSKAFKNCGNIVSVTMPGRFAMKDVFPSSCSKIQDVTILDGEEELLKEVFAGCSALSTVVISEGVTTLGEDLFYGKANLKELTIPSTVTGIGGYALYGCTSLEVIHVSNDGDIDALKQMLYESGFDVESVVFDHVEEPVYVYYKVAFDAQGGVAERTETEVREGKPVGELPTVERDGYEFLGWFTAAVGGTQVTAATVVTRDVTFYAHWKRVSSGADEEIIVGKKVSIATGLKGYKASGLPKGLTYDTKTGKITGTATKVTASEGIVVKFTKKGAEAEELTIIVRAEEVSVGCEILATGSFPAGVVGAAGGIPLQIGTETGVKSVSVTKLPAGMKYDATKKLITGTPTTAGKYTVVLAVTTKTGAKKTVKIPVTVAAMPVMATGTFSGFVTVDDENFGTFTLSATSAGKLTAKVVTAKGTYSFSKAGWNSVSAGVYSATLKSKKGDVLTLTLDSTAAWNADQLTGHLTTAAVAKTKKTAAVPSYAYDVIAQRHAFGKTWYFKAVGDTVGGWTLSYATTASAASLTVTLKADGATAIAGKLPGLLDAKKKAVKLSASGYVNVGGMTEGVIMADFAPIVTVNKVKKTLSIKTNLWFDRCDEHPEGVGEARFVK